MGQKVPPGLRKRGQTWYVYKTIGNRRIRESTGTSDLAEAERYLAHRITEIRNARIYGVRPERVFRDAATKYLKEADKASIRCDSIHLKQLDPFIGDLPLEAVHMGTLQLFIEARRYRKLKDGTMKRNQVRTIKYGLQVVRHILNLCTEWRDETGLTWLAHAPKIKLLREDDKKEPYPLTPDEQVRLFNELPEHLAKMALFKVNAGCREAEVCSLKWEWEEQLPDLSTSVFIVPAHRVKNRQDRLVVLNRVAVAVVEEMRGIHPEQVFTYKGRPIRKMYGAAWRKARERAGLLQVRVHDLKHTFGRRLRAAGVSFEDRQDLLGHKCNRITTHYSMAEIANLVAAANSIHDGQSRKGPALVILKRKFRPVPVKQVGGMSR